MPGTKHNTPSIEHLINVTGEDYGNETNFPDDEEDGFLVWFDSLFIALAFLIVVINTYVHYQFWRKHYLRKIGNLFLIGLATSDLTEGLVGIPLFIGCSATFSDSTCIASALFQRFISFVTMSQLFLVTFDRYIFIIKPLLYQRLISKFTAMVLFTTAWGLSGVVSLIQLIWLPITTIDVNEDSDDQVRLINQWYFFCGLVIFFAIPLCFMVYAHCRILSISIRHFRAVKRGLIGGSNRKRRCFSSLIAAVMLVFFIISWLPYFLMAIQHEMGNDFFELPVWAEDMWCFSRFSTSLLNPLLYMNKSDFRRATKSSLKKLRSKFSSSSSQKQSRALGDEKNGKTGSEKTRDSRENDILVQMRLKKCTLDTVKEGIIETNF